MARNKMDTVLCAECEKEYTRLRDFVEHCLKDCPSCLADYGDDAICGASVQMSLELEDYERLMKGLTDIIVEWRRVSDNRKLTNYLNGIEFCLRALGFEP